MKGFFGGMVAGAVLALLIALAVLYVLDLEISEDDGPEAPTEEAIAVPEFVGEPLRDARAELEALGVEVKAVEVEGPQFFGDPTVLRSVPPAGSELPLDATVTLYWQRE